MARDIPLSDKHGVNPTIPVCFLCNEQKNELILMGKLPGDAEAPRNAVFDYNPCDKCQGYMKQGIILISVSNDSEERDKKDREAYEREKTNYENLRGRQFRPYMQNPYRTGGWVVVAEQYITRVMSPEAAADLMKRRAAFLPDAVWDKIGLPRGAAKETADVPATKGSESGAGGSELAPEQGSGGEPVSGEGSD